MSIQLQTKILYTRTLDIYTPFKAVAVEMQLISVSDSSVPSSPEIDLRVEKKKYTVHDGKIQLSSLLIGRFDLLIGADATPVFAPAQILKLQKLLNGQSEDRRSAGRTSSSGFSDVESEFQRGRRNAGIIQSSPPG